MKKMKKSNMKKYEDVKKRILFCRKRERFSITVAIEFD